MIEGKAIIKGGSIYIKELDITFSKKEIIQMSYEEKKFFFGFMDEEELDRVVNFSPVCEVIVNNIYDRL